MIATVLAVVLVCQEPEPAPPKAEPVQSPAPVDLNDKDAKEAVKVYRQKTKGTPTLAQKLQSLEELGKGRHAELVTVLASVVQSEKLLSVRRRAAEMLSQQPAEAANRAIIKLLSTTGVSDQPQILADLVRGLLRTGYQPKQWADLDGLFDRDYSADRVPLQEAILELVIAKKEAQAIEVLLRNLDEPIPANVDDAANPPAQYWEARYKAWRVWRIKVKDALFAITGQRFTTAAEARAWLKKNPVK
jgi:hypothetical protein